MRKIFCVFMLLITALAFAACDAAPQPDSRIRVSLMENSYFTLEENGILIYPGQNVRFSLSLRPGTVLIGTDYSGEQYIWERDGKTHVELRNVQYPTVVRLDISNHYRVITYDPNGGNGDSAAVTYDISFHRRPNTSQGYTLFNREGWTLTGWNTDPAGTGTRVGLGSRVSVSEEGLTLYAQWKKWTEPADFTYRTNENGLTITGYHGNAEEIVVPEEIDGKPVAAIAAGAFENASARSVILPRSLEVLEDGAFFGAALESVLLFDNLEAFGDGAFEGCDSLQTLYINAQEPPFGYLFRRESMFADKIDLLIENQGRKKLVCYGGCSMWYNMNGTAVQNAMHDYVLINTAINGTVNSHLQMQIIGNYLEAGDVFFHTPELTSKQQLLQDITMDNGDDRLWCGLENNYDLVALADIRGIPGLFDSFCHYLSKKTDAASYRQQYTDSKGRHFMDATGSVPFTRTEAVEELAETSTVFLDPEMVETMDLSLLESFYRDYMDRGVKIYLSYSCFDYDALPEHQREFVGPVDEAFRARINEMGGPVLISTLWDFLYAEKDFFDSAYHLLTPAVDRNTSTWIRDLLTQMAADRQSFE